MENQRIIYTQDNGTVAVIIPTPEALEQHGIEAIAIKDVPPIVVHGPEGSVASSTPRPYKIVDVSDIPSDRTFRGAWEYSDA